MCSPFHIHGKHAPRNRSRQFFSCRIELTSENDLFFHFVHSVDEHSFREMQDIPGIFCAVVHSRACLENESKAHG